MRVNISLFLCKHQNKNFFDLTGSQHSASAGWDWASIHMVIVDSLASMTNTLWRNEQLRANKNLKHIFQCTPKQEDLQNQKTVKFSSSRDLTAFQPSHIWTVVFRSVEQLNLTAASKNRCTRQTDAEVTISYVTTIYKHNEAKCLRQN